MAEETKKEQESKSGSTSSRGKRWRSGGAGAWWRRTAKLWGFLAFCLLILVLARHVVLPFIFALLIAYILSPLVRRMSFRSDNSKRMPTGAAILICYMALLGVIAAFMFLLVPRLSTDVAKIGKQAPALFKQINNEWAPQAAQWLEARLYPNAASERAKLAAKKITAPVDTDPLPPGTQFLVTPLADGRLAIQLSETGVQVTPANDGGYTITPRQPAPEPEFVDKLRTGFMAFLVGMQAQIGDVFRVGQKFLAAFLGSVFKFFLVLMIAAFIMIDMRKIHKFVRGLFPANFRDDYDIIVAGIDRGLSGVIRGQLIICLVNGVLTYIGLLIFAVNYSLILAVVAAVLSLIPIFGSILSTVPVILVALVSGDEGGVDVMRAIFITAWIVGIHFVEANLLNPKIIGTAAKMHPVLVIFALVLGEHSFGLTGALLAVPTASIIQVLFQYFRRKAWRLETGFISQAAPAAQVNETE